MSMYENNHQLFVQFSSVLQQHDLADPKEKCSASLANPMIGKFVSSASHKTIKLLIKAGGKYVILILF